jgi:hypothetical protein
MKNDGFWDVTPCGSCKNRRFGGTWRLLHQGDKNLLQTIALFGRRCLLVPHIPVTMKERDVGSSERHYGWGEQNISSVLNVPKHCPFVLLVSVNF